MRPFFSYYGSRWSMARNYTPPTSTTVVEPFAGSAGYSTYWAPEVAHLVEINPGVAAVWRYLIGADADAIMTLPDRVESMVDLPVDVGARNLILLWVNKGRAEIPTSISPWYFRYRDDGDCKVWGPAVKSRLAGQVGRINRWTITEGGYRLAPIDHGCHVHVDPPFSVGAGRRYDHSEVDYAELARWCETVTAGHVQVCESSQATWLPFRPLCQSETTRGKRDGSKFDEGVWDRPGGLLLDAS